MPEYVKVDLKIFMVKGGNDAIVKIRLSKSSPFEVKMLVEFIRRGISVLLNIQAGDGWLCRGRKIPRTAIGTARDSDMKSRNTRLFLRIWVSGACWLVLGLILVGCRSVQKMEAPLTLTSPPNPKPVLPTATFFPPTATPLPFEGLKEWDLVMISASGLWNVTEPYARLIEQDRGVKVVGHDETQGDLTARDILKALQGDSGGSFKREKWPQLIRDAEVLVLSLGTPNGSLPEEQRRKMDDCMASPPPGQSCCTAESIAPFNADWDAIWNEIATLREGRPLIVRAVEMYNPWLARLPDGESENTGRACYDIISTAFRQSAETYGVPVVNAYDALNGPNHDQDLDAKGLLRDGVHLNEAGVKLMVELLQASGYSTSVVQP
jgi:hypothetical protein